MTIGPGRDTDEVLRELVALVESGAFLYESNWAYIRAKAYVAQLPPAEPPAQCSPPTMDAFSFLNPRCSSCDD